MSEAQKTDLTRDRIIRVATGLFAVNGYHATSMAELQAAVGFQRGGLYHYIGSKEAILFDICKRALDEAVARAQEVIESDSGPLDQLHEMGRQWMSHIADNKSAWTVFFRDYASLSEKRRAEISGQRDEIERCWRAILEHGIEAGAMREVNPIVVNGILGMFNYAYLWLDPEGALSPEEIADTFVDLAVHGVASPAMRPRAAAATRA